MRGAITKGALLLMPHKQKTNIIMGKVKPAKL